MKDRRLRLTFAEQMLSDPENPASYDALFEEENHGYRKKITCWEDFHDPNVLEKKIGLVNRSFSKNPITRLGARIEVMLKK